MDAFLAKMRKKQAGRECWLCDHEPHPDKCPVGECLCYGQTALGER